MVTAKAKEAYRILQRPVLIEDTALTIESMNGLPGTFIKWFLERLHPEGLCRLADADGKRLATAACAYAYYDGTELTLFTGSKAGTIAESPRGDEGFGWNPVFIPEGANLTLGEIDEASFTEVYMTIKPIAEVREFLTKG